MAHILVDLLYYSLGDSKDTISLETLLKMLSLIFWCVFYILVQYKTDGRRSPEWGDRVVTLAHGSLSGILGAYMCEYDCSSFDTLGEVCSMKQYMLMLMSWGYFLFDLIWCVMYWYESALMLFHHLFSLLFIERFMEKHWGGCVYCCAMGGLEITNPCLQIRWLLRDAHMEDSVEFVVVEMTYFISFLLIRGVIGSIVTVKAIMSKVDLELKIMAIILWIVSILFIYDIYIFARRKLSSRMEVLWSHN